MLLSNPHHSSPSPLRRMRWNCSTRAGRRLGQTVSVPRAPSALPTQRSRRCSSAALREQRKCARWTAFRPMRACGRTRSGRPHLSDNGSSGSLVLESAVSSRRRPGSCGRMPERSDRIEAFVALVAQRRPDGLCGPLPDEDTRPEAVVERHEPSGLGVGARPAGSSPFSGRQSHAAPRPARGAKRRRYSPGVRPVRRLNSRRNEAGSS